VASNLGIDLYDVKLDRQKPKHVKNIAVSGEYMFYEVSVYLIATAPCQYGGHDRCEGVVPASLSKFVQDQASEGERVPTQYGSR